MNTRRSFFKSILRGAAGVVAASMLPFGLKRLNPEVPKPELKLASFVRPNPNYPIDMMTDRFTADRLQAMFAAYYSSKYGGDVK